ncbi:TonB-dependent receptor domain-containing protein [Mucilaginibacter phyllosphaerae]
MRVLMFSLLFALIGYAALGQVSGKLTDMAGKPISYATASLLKATDSVSVRSTLTGENGEYSLGNVPPGKYLLRFSSVGYSVLFTSSFELAANQPLKDMDTQILRENSKQLNEIVIRADKPLLMQRADGTVINVENSVMTKGSSALEVLERSPGVVIDHQNNGLILNGKSGVMVMLNGKPIRMALDQVVRMLGGMSANEIAKIELLTSPSAAYDADGNAGLINIVTKKSEKQGTNGSASLTAGYGYGVKATGGLSLDHNTGKTNWYGSYNYSHDKTYSDFHAVGTEQEPLLGGWASSDFVSIDNPVLNNHQATLGLDLKPVEGLVIGGSLNYNNSNNTVHTSNKGVYLVPPDNIYRLNATVDGFNYWRNVTSNLYAEKQFTKGRKLSLNIDHINYKNDYHIDVLSSFLDQNSDQAGNNDTLFSPRAKGLANTHISIWAPKIDYTKVFGSKLILAGGLKATQTRTNSESAIQNLVNGAYVSRPSAVNQILMKEEIGAAYSSLSYKPDRSTELMAGLRYEYSTTRISDLLAVSSLANRNLGMWFPSILLTKKINNDSEWSLSYSKRISRPSYNDLASYVTYNGPASVNTGNPLLKPTVTNNLKLGYNYHGYAFAALLSRDDNPIARNQIVYTADRMQMAVSPQNMLYQNNLAFQANIPISPTAWWDMSYNLNAGWHQFKIEYTPQPAERTYFSYNLNTMQVFKLPAKLSIELSGYYNSPFYNGSRKVDGYGVLNAGIRKVLKNNNGSLQLSLSDPLHTNVIGSYFGKLTQEAFDLKSHVDFHTESSQYMVIKLSYSKSFGVTTSTRRIKIDKNALEESERIGH